MRRWPGLREYEKHSSFKTYCYACGAPIVMHHNGVGYAPAELGRHPIPHLCPNARKQDDPRKGRFGNKRR